MKRFLCIALPLAALGLAGCGGADGADKAPVPADKAAASDTATPGGSQAPSSAPATATSHTPYTQGGTPGNADQATVKFTKCENTPNGVDMEAEITNTTKDKRTYIVTGMVFDEKKKAAGSAALMVDDLEPGKSAKATGKSNESVKGKITCEASQIDSMASGS